MQEEKLDILKSDNNKKIILGIDVGLCNTGYAFAQLDLLTDNICILQTGIIKTQKKELRLKKIYQSWCDIFEHQKPSIAFVEIGFVNINSKTSLKLMSGQSITLLCLELINCPIMEIASTRIKKQILGRGHASKQDSIEYVKEKFGLLVKDHISDAILALLAGIKLYRQLI